MTFDSELPTGPSGSQITDAVDDSTPPTADADMAASVIDWDSSAPLKLVAAEAEGDAVAWGKQLRDLDVFDAVTQRMKKAPAEGLERLRWSGSEPDGSISGGLEWSTETRELLRSLLAFDVKSSKKDRHHLSTVVDQWLDVIELNDPWSISDLLAGLTILPLYSRVLEPRVITRLWQATFAAGCRVLDHLHQEETVLPVAVDLVARVEIPWLLGHLHGVVQGANRLLPAAALVLTQRAESLLDAEGHLQIGQLHELWPTLGAIVRVLAWAEVWQTEVCDQATLARFSKLAERLAAFTVIDGSVLFQSTSAPATPASTRGSVWKVLQTGWSVPIPEHEHDHPVLQPHSASVAASGTSRGSVWKLLKATRSVLELDDDHPVSVLLKVAARGDRDGDKVSKSGTKVAQQLAHQSDEGEYACLRSGVSSLGAAAALRCDGHGLRMDTHIGAQPWLMGEWKLELAHGEGAASAAGAVKYGEFATVDIEWACCSFFSDEDCDYAEYEGKISEGLVVFRQVFLARRDHWGMFADSLRSEVDQPVAIRSSLPLTAGWSAAEDSETREWQLTRKDGPTIRAFPVALAQENIHKSPGRCVITRKEIQLLIEAEHGSAYAPIVFDWSPRRADEPAEWLRLTVGEQFRTVPPWVAAGHRLRTGDLHLLVYHSLKRSQFPRSALGHHTAYETAIGSFTDKGTVTSFVCINYSS